MVNLDNALDDIQPEAAATVALVHPAEGFYHFSHCAFFDAGAFIADGDFTAIIAGSDIQCDGAVLWAVA